MARAERSSTNFRIHPGSILPMISTIRRRHFSEFALLFALGYLFFATNRWVTFFDDEVAIVTAAAAPVHQTLQLFWNGQGMHQHPPLYDLLLHFWLRFTGARFSLLRLPGIASYLLGLWMLSRAAEE